MNFEMSKPPVPPTEITPNALALHENVSDIFDRHPFSPDELNNLSAHSVLHNMAGFVAPVATIGVIGYGLYKMSEGFREDKTKDRARKKHLN
jgi:hypothetical protein